MTGYGMATFESEECQYTVEIKSLNSKYLEINLKIPRSFSTKELLLRNEGARLFGRGKVNIQIQAEHHNPLKQAASINIPLLKHYYQVLKQTADELEAPLEGLFRETLNFPDIILQDDVESDESEWLQVYEVFLQAYRKFDEFRKDEGTVLKDDLQYRAEMILTYLQEVERLEPNRIPKIRERIENALKDWGGKELADPNRLEQELIYHIDKLDITEEKVRLKSHCAYFLKSLNSEETSGKKLGFVSQEMGREINTLGSKANDAEIQQIVVRMKEELEKIKEQLLNVI